MKIQQIHFFPLEMPIKFTSLTYKYRPQIDYKTVALAKLTKSLKMCNKLQNNAKVEKEYEN